MDVYPGLYDDPHRRSLTSGDHSSSRLAPLTLTPVVPVTNLTAACPSKVGPIAQRWPFHRSRRAFAC